MPASVLKEAIQAQTDVGWKNVVIGRLVSKWQTAVMLTNEGEVDMTRPKDGEHWSQKVSSLMINFGIQIWKRQNGAVHGMTREDKRKIRRAQVIGKVQLLYQKRPKLQSSDDSRLLGVPLTKKIRGSTSGLEAWVSHVGVAEKSYCQFWECKEHKKKQLALAEWVKGNINREQPGASRRPGRGK